MGVYIKGMEMPKSCGFCRLRHADTFHGDACSVTIGLWCEFLKRPDNCPLVHVPPHGRLVDADRLSFAMMDAANADQAMAMADDAPTVIEAEEGE